MPHDRRYPLSAAAPRDRSWTSRPDIVSEPNTAWEYVIYPIGGVLIPLHHHHCPHEAARVALTESPGAARQRSG
jgi:hypothetical protein